MPGAPDEEPARQRRAGKINQAEHAKGHQGQTQADQHQCIEPDLTLGLGLAGHNIHHWDLRRGVVARLHQGERPEVRGRPHKDNHEQGQRGEIQPIGDGRPADQRGNGAGPAADDDVLGRAALEPHRVDHGVVEETHQRQHGRQQIDKHREQEKRQRAQAQPECQRNIRRNTAGRNRPDPGAIAQDLVDVMVIGHVDGPGPARH